jgi:hypothetical protein
MSELTLSTVLVRSEEPLTARVDDGLVMLDDRQSAYFGLDATGTAIWELLDQPRTVAQVCAELIERYDIDEADCRRDVLAFLAELLAARLVEPRTFPPEA